MIQSFFLSLGQLLDKPIARVFLKSLAVTIILFVATGAGLWLGSRWLMANWGPARSFATWAFGAEGGASTFADLVSIVAMLLAAWLLFRAIAIAVIGIFADEVVVAVEARYYPDALKTGRDVSFWRSVRMGLGSAGRALLVNLALAPLYLVLLMTGVGTAIAFFVVNSWLLGRDLGDMVAARHVSADGLARWRARTGFRRFVLGAVGTGMFLVPVLNLIAPVLGAAMATHAFHRGRKA